MTNDLLTLLRDHRSQNGWLPEDVDLGLIEQAYDRARWGPTSMNSQPMRLLVLQSSEAREHLTPALAPGNVVKAQTAPILAIIAYDSEFHESLPRVFPHNPAARDIFAADIVLRDATGFRNGTLQAAYFMLALRSSGLDVSPMSGFDEAAVNATFFSDSSWRVNFLCGIGRGDHTKLFDRLPRLDFADAVKFV